MAIYLIVGQPRHGKSQFAAKMAYDYEQNNIKVRKKSEAGKPLDPEKDLLRNVYSDINGHAENCSFVQKAPDDWREVPEDSVIFYDEIHLCLCYRFNQKRLANCFKFEHLVNTCIKTSSFKCQKKPHRRVAFLKIYRN